MAPALVEHSAAQERNSSSKKYLEKLTCIPPIDLVIGDNIKCIDSKTLLNSKLFSTVMVSEKDNLIETHHSSAKIIQTSPCIITNYPPNSLSENPLPKETIPVQELSRASVMAILPGETGLNTIQTSTCIASISASTAMSRTTEPRAEQPIAGFDKSKLVSFIKQKENSVQSKYTAIHKNLSQLADKIKKIRLLGVNSHIAKNVQLAPEFTDNKITAGVNNKTVTDQKDAVIINATSLSPTSRQKLCELNTKFCSVYDAVKHLEDNDTDFEEDYDSCVRVPISRGKRKNENPRPSPASLRQWKEKRCKIGSQCSWLSLQISALDKKIACLQCLHKKIKSERQASRTIHFEQTSLQNEADSATAQSGLQHSSSMMSLSAQEDITSNRGCSRTCLMSGSWTHKYIRKPDIKPPSEKFQCQNAASIQSCQLCSQTGRKLTISPNRVDLLDASFHERLSFQNETSLSLLLEETLRKENINTRVTITKPTKKKKKVKPKDNQSLAADKKNGPDNLKVVRNAGQKSDEHSRKRLNTDSTGRVRKMRKFSDSYSYDSSKPSTPTNELISPLSNSLNSISGLKNKKKFSSGGDYDINNIVIPYSIAASTRVERIQYKEIPTPGWRNIDFELDEKNRDEDLELTDDDTYIERHARCEILERKRFNNFFHLSMNRRRSRLSEGPTSQPPSPLVIDDTFKSNVVTPADSPVGLNSSKNTSGNIQLCIEDERDPPWSYRKFPLSDKDLRDLEVSDEIFLEQSQLPSSPVPNTLESLHEVSQKLLTSSTTSTTPMVSPLLHTSTSSSPLTSSELNLNWAISNEQPVDVATLDKQRKGIVLKLAKK